MSDSWRGDLLLETLDRLSVLDRNIKPSRRKVLDFLLTPAQASAKIQNDAGGLTRLELQLRPFSETEWAKIATLFASKAYFLSIFLNDLLPLKVEEELQALGLSLFPTEKKDLLLQISGGDRAQHQLMLATFSQHFAQHLTSNPFAIFLWRGKGKEELLFDLEQARQALSPKINSRPKTEPLSSAIISSVSPNSASLNAPTSSSGHPGETAFNPETRSIEPKSSADTLNPEVANLSFNIKADELPAALLKRLEPLPLSGLEEELDSTLETAYNQITRRSQSYGFGL